MVWVNGFGRAVEPGAASVLERIPCRSFWRSSQTRRVGWLGARAADALAGAEGLDGDAVAEDDFGGAPDGSAAGGAGEGLGDEGVVE